MMALKSVGTPGMTVGLRVVDEAQRVIEREARHDDDLGALGDAEVHDDGEREDVEEGQDAQDPLLAVVEIGGPGGDLLHVDVDVGVREHRPFRRAGGAARVLQHGDVAQGIDRHRSEAAGVGQQVAFEDDAVARGRGLRPGEVLRFEQPKQRRLGGGQQRRERAYERARQHLRLQKRIDLVEEHLQVERHHELGVAVLDLAGELADRIEGIVVDDGAAGFQHGEEVDDEGRGVGQEQADLRALLDAVALQSGRGLIDEAADLGVAQRLAEKVVQGSCPCRATVSSSRRIERSHRQRHAPIDPARVALEPRQGGGGRCPGCCGGLALPFSGFSQGGPERAA